MADNVMKRGNREVEKERVEEIRRTGADHGGGLRGACAR
jgi:hypothetical protein